MSNRFVRTAFASAIVGGLLGTFVGCEPKGPAERAGERVDQGIQNAKDAIDPAGPGEKAGRAIDRATDK